MTSIGSWQTMKMQQGSRENNITGSWKGYQNLSSSSTSLWTPTVEQEEPCLLSPPALPLPTLHRGGRDRTPDRGSTGHDLSFLGMLLAPYPPTLPDLLGVEQTPSVGRGLATLGQMSQPPGRGFLPVLFPVCVPWERRLCLSQILPFPAIPVALIVPSGLP